MNWLTRRRNTEVCDPFRDLWSLEREVNRLFPEVGTGALFSSIGDGNGSWVAPLEVYETKDKVVVRAELPGARPEDINVSVLGNSLSIKAERKQESESKERNVYRREFAYGVFARQIDLPQTVKADDIEADYKDGILEISLPKREEAKPKQVQVKVKGA